MLPATITKIHQAFKEVKQMAIDTWQEECRFAARHAMKEVLERRMHNAVDAHLEEMRAVGAPAFEVFFSGDPPAIIEPQYPQPRMTSRGILEVRNPE